MNLLTQSYAEQQACWPKTGRVILAQADANSVVVYQAYRPSIGRFAAEQDRLGGDGFSITRMTWIKPNFLWMMYRSGWGTKAGQEVTLAIRLARNAFDQILAQAVHSSFNPDVYSSPEHWQQAVASSQVRLQWDPDHGPTGAPLERRAIQLGLRGPVMEKFTRDWILGIEDISEFVEGQRQIVAAGHLDQLITPREDVYIVSDPTTAARLGVDQA